VILAVSFGTAGVAVFFLSMLTLFAKAGQRNRAVGALRCVLAIIYALLFVAGIAGLCFSGWVLFAGGGKAAVLLVLTIPLSLTLTVSGARLFRYVTSTSETTVAPRPLQSSRGWGDLALASEKTRQAGVAPHLRPEALIRRGRNDQAMDDSRE
jgi:hypothetical protein